MTCHYRIRSSMCCDCAMYTSFPEHTSRCLSSLTSSLSSRQSAFGSPTLSSFTITFRRPPNLSTSHLWQCLKLVVAHTRLGSTRRTPCAQCTAPWCMRFSSLFTSSSRYTCRAINTLHPGARIRDNYDRNVYLSQNIVNRLYLYPLT